MSVCRAIAHCGSGPAQEIDPREIDSLLAQKDNLLWLDIQDPGQAEIDLLRKQAGYGRLAAARRAPQHDRSEAAARDHSCERAVALQQMILADDLIQTLRTQAVRERPRRGLVEQPWSGRDACRAASRLATHPDTVI